ARHRDRGLPRAGGTGAGGSDPGGRRARRRTRRTVRPARPRPRGRGRERSARGRSFGGHGTIGRVSHATAISAEPVIRVEGLRKHYGETAAVDGVSFEVPPGTIFGLLGPNGAGKTTTVEVLEGLREADAGQVRVLGIDALQHADDLRARIGVSLQTA